MHLLLNIGFALVTLEMESREKLVVGGRPNTRSSAHYDGYLAGLSRDLLLHSPPRFVSSGALPESQDWQNVSKQRYGGPIRTQLLGVTWVTFRVSSVDEERCFPHVQIYVCSHFRPDCGCL